MSREMRHSGIEWIGEIPKEWKVTLSKRLFTIVAGATPKTDNVEMWDGDITWITPADYKTEDKYVMSGRRNLSEKGKKSCATYLLPCNTIVFSKRAPIGLVAITAKELCTNQGCLGCIPNGQLIVLFYYYAMSAFTEQFELLGTGTTFKEISATKFANFPLPFPPLSEQQKIANYLDKVCGEVDEMIALQEQMIEELKAYKQSVITEAVTKGLNPDVPMKDSGVDWIGEVPEGWKVSRLKYYSNFINGFAFNSDVFSLEIGCKVIRIGDISQSLDFDGCVRANIKTDTLQSYRIKNNDIIIAMSGATTGKCCIAKDVEEAYINQRVGIIRCDNYSYVYYSLQTDYFMEYINLNNAGSAQPNVSGTSIGNFPLLVPSLDEQQSIASYLDTKCSEIDALIAIKQAKIEELKDYKKSVIYEYVTGKKEVV